METLTTLKSSTLVRYLPIGFSAFLLDISLLNLGLALGLHLLIANGIAVSVAIVYSFLLHRRFTFVKRAEVKGYKLHSRNQFLLFTVNSLAMLMLSEASVFWLVNSAHLKPNPAKVITNAILFLWNYGFNRLVTFR